MLGGVTPIVSVLGAAPAPDADTATLKSFARACASIGLHLILIEPGGKKPVDMRSPVRRRNDDGAAKDAARAEGRPDWDKVVSKSGVYLATDNTKLLDSYIERYRKTYGDSTPVNFGVAVGPSKLIVVDCDTAAQGLAFLSDFGWDPNTPPTVRSPGQRDADGNWAHSDGGHFYFTVDEPMPEESGSLTGPGGYAVLWANRYVLIPPSVRPEGPYSLVGQDFPAPEHLIGAVRANAEAKVSRRRDRDQDSVVTTAVDLWAGTLPWEDLLAPAGWSRAARQDNCGCDTWTAPGDHASPKSATAHDDGCTLGRYTQDNAPLHIWTDNPGPELEAWVAAHSTKTLSKLQVIAALEYGGNVGEAMRELQVIPDETGALAFGRDQDFALGVSRANLEEPLRLDTAPAGPVAGTYTLTSRGPDGKLEQTFDHTGAFLVEVLTPPDLFAVAGRLDDTEAAEDSPFEPAVPAGPLPGVPIVRPFRDWRDMPPPQFVVEGLIENKGLAAIIGAPGVGKSGVALDLAAAICTGARWVGRRTLQQRVLYLPGEGLAGSVQRLRAWESAHDRDLGDDLFIGDSIIQVAASNDVWSGLLTQITAYRISTIIIDTFARASVGLEENSATDVGRAISKFGQVKAAADATLIVVHHTAKASTAGRGSSALNGALDTELLIQETTWDSDEPCPGRPLLMSVSKQKNAAVPEHGIELMAVPWDDSFIITGPNGIVDDPLDGVATVRAVEAEPMINIAIRLWDFAGRFPSQGVTRSDLAYGVEPDAVTDRRRDAKTAWKLKVGEAVDLALKYDLLQTLTGAATGARYILGPGTPERARSRWAADMITD